MLRSGLMYTHTRCLSGAPCPYRHTEPSVIGGADVGGKCERLTSASQLHLPDCTSPLSRAQTIGGVATSRSPRTTRAPSRHSRVRWQAYPAINESCCPFFASTLFASCLLSPSSSPAEPLCSLPPSLGAVRFWILPLELDIRFDTRFEGRHNAFHRADFQR